MLRYWHEILMNPNKVLFLKYEEMKENTSFQLKKIAEFLGVPFTWEEEEEEGVVEGIAKLCSFEHMKELEVNKNGKGAIVDFENKNLFRKGLVGDWVNYFTPMMVERLSNGFVLVPTIAPMTKKNTRSLHLMLSGMDYLENLKLER
ncbi:hypothetical protein ACS0TY_003359 [Phlomoides rotata]